MRNTIFLLLIYILAIKTAAAETWRFASGSKKGTYYAIGQTLNKLPGTRVKVLETAGSIENIELIATKKADIGLAQLDVFTDSKLIDENMRDNVRMVLPIYREEIHILTMTDEKRKLGLPGLKEAEIYVGPKGSGTAATAEIIFRALKIREDMEFKYESTSKGIEELLAGQGDYAMLVGGAPLEVISYHGDKFFMVPFDRPTQLAFTTGDYPYKRTRMEKGIYTWLQQDTPTISIASVIIAHKNADKKKITRLIKNIYRKRRNLGKAHHKWEELDIEYARYILQSYPRFAFPGAYKTIKRYRGR